MNDYGPVQRDPAPEWCGHLHVRTADLAPAGWLTERSALAAFTVNWA